MAVITCTPLTDAVEQRQRFEMIGRMAGGVFHSLNNSLAVIQGRVDLLKTQLSDAKTSRSLNSIALQTQKITEASRMVQSLSVRVIQYSAFQLRELIDFVFIDSELKPEIIGDGEVYSDPQAFLDVLRRMIHRLCQSGSITSIGIQLNDPVANIDIYGKFNRDLEVLSQLSNPQRMLRCFDKGDIGLANMAMLLLDHRITFSVRSNEQIRLSIPIQYQNARPWSPELDQSKSLRVLIVDDSPSLRETLLTLLSLDGHIIFTANSAEDALPLISQLPDILLVDIRLPNMSGLELLNYLREHHSDLSKRVILISGKVVDFPDNTPFLKKPFTHTQLLLKIQEVVDNQESNIATTI